MPAPRVVCEVCGPTDRPITELGGAALCFRCCEDVYRDAACELAAEEEVLAVATLAECLTLDEARCLTKVIRGLETIN